MWELNWNKSLSDLNSNAKLQDLEENHMDDKHMVITWGKEDKKHLKYFLGYLNRMKQNAHDSNWWDIFAYGTLCEALNIA